MSSLFSRKPIADLVIDSDHPGALKRALGAGDLIMLAIGAVIGAGIFGSIGSAAADCKPFKFLWVTKPCTSSDCTRRAR